MTTKEAIQAMLDGKKVRHTQCGVGSYNKNVWEIYEESKPKQTVTIEKWLCASGFNMAYYTVEATKEYFDRYTKDRVKLLDTYDVTL